MKLISITIFATLFVFQMTHADIKREKDGSRTVGVKTDIIDKVYTQQKKTQWCWAACIQMLMAHHGITVSQESIVRRSYGQDPLGRLPDWPGSFELITRNLNYQGVDEKGVPHVVQSAVRNGPPSPAVLINELKNNHPFIIGYHTGTGGHAVLVTGANYRGLASRPVVRALFVRDPFPAPGTPANGRRIYQGHHLAKMVMAHWIIRVKAQKPDEARLNPEAQTNEDFKKVRSEYHAASIKATNFEALWRQAFMKFQQTGHQVYNQQALQYKIKFQKAQREAQVKQAEMIRLQQHMSSSKAGK